MKKEVLKNIIDYVSTEEIDVSFEDSLNESLYESEFSLHILTPSLIWMDLSNDLKFDKVSKHLLKKLKLKMLLLSLILKLTKHWLFEYLM